MLTPERIALMRQGVVHDDECPEQEGACSYDCIHNNLDELLDGVTALRTALADALEGMEDMIPYVDPYLSWKWEHADYIERARVALNGTEMPAQAPHSPERTAP